jgi:phospholipid N-methyltransferase
MSGKKPLNFQLNGRMFFFRQFLRHPLQIGSIIPSSRFLERRIVEAAGIASADVVVELGPGTGGTTRAILRTMPRHARLLSIEINPHFHAMVSGIDDDRLIAHRGNACELGEILLKYGLDAPSAIVSGIPFSTLDQNEASDILEAISSLLARDGHFVAYQVTNRVATLCQPFMGPGRATMEFLNIPPMRIYQWDKHDA